MIHALVLAALLPANSAAAQQAEIQSTLQLFSHARSTIEREVGKDQAIDVGIRLVQDGSEIGDPVPDGYSAADWNETMSTVISVDTQAIRDLAKGARKPLSIGEKGLHERFVVSSVDGMWLPVAVYIPPNAAAGAPLAVLLHGNPQTDSELLAQPYFRRLADRTGTILIAPWGRGSYDYEGIAAKDVYDALNAAQRELSTDPRRTFLVGYSMGGFSVFKIGPEYGHWSAVMDISGALLNSEVAQVRFSWRDTPVYVITGKHDVNIPAVYGEETATYLASIGVPTGFYEQPDGVHYVRTLVPALTAAWSDMHAGVIRRDAVPAAAAALPSLPSVEMRTSGLKP
jgi:poly(3-hydroxybutyrate) depolymerase